MPKLPVISGKELIKILFKLGFIESRQTGSHKIFKHSDGRTTSVPMHSGEDLGKGLLRKILHQIEVPPDQFQKLLKR
ncbi:MAG: type II toxin-antitoxin system HicA family toxin [Candidatus Daviesbacteria bacterium]|nr:type II toxin-antitoxin system HicA family toxin [Candidatus Daviesbacteria bacterium]